MPGSENSELRFYYTYVIKSTEDDDLYIGYTQDLRKRIKEHNRKQNFSTKSSGPWELIYYEACLNQGDAKRREKYFKTSQGRRLLKRRLKEYFYSKNKSII